MTSSYIERVRQQKAEMEAKAAKKGGSRVAFWKPSTKNVIRVLPTLNEEGEPTDFWREVFQHWNVKEEQGGPVLCPKKTVGFPEGEGCPVCDFVDALRKNKTSVAAQQVAKEVRAKETFLLPIIDLKDPVYKERDVASNDTLKLGDPKVQIYACPSTVFNDILGIIDTNSLDITSLTEGHDLAITKQEKAGNKQFATYSVTLMVKPTKAPVPEDFVTIGWKMTYKELVALVAEGKGGDFNTKKALGKGSEEEKEDDSFLNTDSSSEDDDLKRDMKAALGLDD